MATQTIKHGRRAGSARDEKTQTKVVQPQQTQAIKGHSIVLGHDEWQRLQVQASGAPEVNSQTVKLQERDRLHELSQQSVSEWTNTIQGQRQQKLQAKAIREQKEEERRIQQDIEEARFQAEKRKEAIQRARALQYAQTDRAKGLQSGVILAEVLRERESQRIIKAQREEMLALEELELHQLTLKGLVEAAQVEDEAQRAVRANALQLATSQIEQAAEKRTLRISRRQQQLEEQQVIDDRALQFHAECEEAEQARRKHAATWKVELEDQSRIKGELTAHSQMLDSQEESRRLNYVASKDRLAQLKREKESERVREADRQRGVVINQLEQSMDRREAEEAELRDRIQAEKEAAAQQLDDEKKRKVAENISAIRAHHIAERQRLDKQRQQLQQAAEQERRDNEEADKKFAVGEQARTIKQKQMRATTDDDCIEQMAAHRAARSAAEFESVAEREAIQRAAVLEEAIFQEFAMRELEKAKARGCTNVIPVIRAIAPVDPPRAPVPLSVTLAKRGPGNPHPGNTKMRMGFTL